MKGKRKKRSALDELIQQTLREIEERRSRMTPAERARCDKKTLEIAARISARHKRSET
jgi:hypothetical protein